MMMPFEWDVRVSSKDHTVTAPTSRDEPATVGYTTLWGTTPRHPFLFEGRATGWVACRTSPNRRRAVRRRPAQLWATSAAREGRCV